MNAYVLGKLFNEAMTPLSLMMATFLYLPPSFLTAYVLHKLGHPGMMRALLLVPLYLISCLVFGLVLGILTSTLISGNGGALILLFPLLAGIGFPLGLLSTLILLIFYDNSRRGASREEIKAGIEGKNE